ncbi:hypothetical protein HA466_0244500 [Hirschfeldia incana]|nr:hypothetical protein HA466_0244500 [Hirschfeldia incana]
MVDKTSVGQSNSKSTCAFPQGLNDSVKAKFIEENPDVLIMTSPSFFSQFTLSYSHSAGGRFNGEAW